MSPKTKQRRRRRRAVAAIISILQAKPRREDPPFVGIYARDGRLIGDMCYFAALTKWEMLSMIACSSSVYVVAVSRMRAEL